MQVIEPLQYAKKERNTFRRNTALSLILGVGGVLIFILPVTGLISVNFLRSNLNFGGFVLIDLILVGAGIWLGRLAWLYYYEQAIQARVILILSQLLNDEYKYLRNLNSLANRATVWPKRWWAGGPGEAGGVLLGPHGAWVLQICRYRGIYACEGDTWYKYSRPQSNKPVTENENLLNKRRLDDSPNWQVIRAAREVKAWLSVRELPQVMVQPVVVLAHGKIRFSKRPSCPIVELWYLETYIKKTLVTISTREADPVPMSEAVVSQLMERLI